MFGPGEIIYMNDPRWAHSQAYQNKQMIQQDYMMMQMSQMQNGYAQTLRNLNPCRYCQQIDWGKHSCNRCGASKEKS